MTKTLLIFVAIFAALTPVVPSAETGVVTSVCNDRWPKESAKWKRCIKAYNRGNKTALNYVKRHRLLRKARAVDAGRATSGPYLKIFNRCSDLWWRPRYKSYEFDKYGECLKNRERGYRAKLQAARRSDRVLGRLEDIAMIKKMPNISLVAWANGGKDSHLNVDVQERGQDYASDSRAYCDILKTKGVRGAKVSVWSADAKKKSPPKEVLLTHRRC